MSLVIQPITPDDVSAVQELAYAYNLELDPQETTREAVNRWIASACQKTQIGEQAFWLAFAGDRMIGFVSFFLQTNPFTQETSGFIEDFYLISEYRGQGYAQELAQQAFAELHRRGAGRILLDVLATNPRALRFWRKAGFALHHYVLSMPLNDEADY